MMQGHHLSGGQVEYQSNLWRIHTFRTMLQLQVPVLTLSHASQVQSFGSLLFLHSADAVWLEAVPLRALKDLTKKPCSK